jgi:hypothetical protein
MGPTGPTGPSYVIGTDKLRFIGDGPPPPYIEGAQPGDQYIDRETGILYQLT